MEAVGQVVQLVHFLDIRKYSLPTLVHLDQTMFPAAFYKHTKGQYITLGHFQLSVSWTSVNCYQSQVLSK